MAPKPLSPTVATREIKRIAQLHRVGKGEIRLTTEAQTDTENPRNWAHDVTLFEVHSCLENGKVLREPTFNSKYDEWTYSMEFAYDTCDLLTVTAIFSEENVIRVITRYKKSKSFDKTKPKARKPRKT